MHPEPNSSRPACSPVLAFSSTETEIKEIPFPLLVRKNQTNKYTALSRTIITNHIIYSINQKNILKKNPNHLEQNFNLSSIPFNFP